MDRLLAWIFGMELALMLGVGVLRAQSQQTHLAASQPAGDLITLNFPDNVELKVLIEYVSERLGLNILYDEQQVSQKITIKSPSQVSKASLQGLLESALMMKGLVLVDAEQRGWKRVVPLSNLAAAAKPATMPATGTAGASSVVIQVFVLKHAEPQKVEAAVKPFLTTPGGNSIVLPEQRTLIVTDYAGTIQRIADLVGMLDQPHRQIAVEFVLVKNADPQQLAQEVTQVLAAKTKAQGGTVTAGASDGVEITEEPRTSRLVVVGSPERVQEVTQLIQQIDVPLELQTKTYTFTAISPERIDRLVRELVGPLAAQRLYQSVIDKEGNLLIVTSTVEIHQKLASLKQELDVAVKSEQSPLRFYKLENTTAAEVLETIQAIEGDNNEGGASSSGGPTSQPAPLASGGIRPTAGAGLQPSPPPITNGVTSAPQPPPQLGQASQSTQGGQSHQTVHAKGATVTADPNTNSIIVIADSPTQQLYEQLIKQLDKRRPQVLIECTIVTLDTSNNFSLGVELSGHGDGSTPNVVTFSSFGLSTPNATTGALSLLPGAGFNGALIKAGLGEMVIRALSGDSHTQVVSAPRILVNDNATGSLTSVAEEPYTSVNASTTVATTSFAGYASAGTTIALTPHISEGEHLQLQYVITLNSFTGQAANGQPPPRQTNSVQSEVTVPDGDTIVVGGLNNQNLSDTVNRVPLLGQIPVLEYLFSNRSHNSDHSTLFVFIRPVILRDDLFRDLKYFSEQQVKEAGQAPDLPESQPLLIE